MTTTRILIALDVPTALLVEAYGTADFAQPGSVHEADLVASLAARLDEFYPGEDGYVTPTSVTSVVVDTDGPELSLADLRGVYGVGIDGVLDAQHDAEVAEANGDDQEDGYGPEGRECDACGAAPHERCRVGCLGQAAWQDDQDALLQAAKDTGHLLIVRVP